jgi:quinol-cytochrome oxidoreductase complex cytochrome b subunit
MNGVGRPFLRFAAIVIAVDVVGLGAWSLLPPASRIRTGVLLGTLVVAPLLGFLLVYAPAASRAGE